MTLPPPPPLYPTATSDEDSLPSPSLDPEAVADDEDLAVLVDELVARDPEARTGLRDIALRQAALRQADPETWPLVLMVEEMMTARFADLLVVVARWAFMEGQRHPLPKSQDVSNVSPDEQTSGPPRGGA